jgi:hypothetical protein
VITPKDRFRIDEKLKQLQEVDTDQALKLIWEWSKQNTINFGVFKMLMREVSNKVIAKQTHDEYMDEEW